MGRCHHPARAGHADRGRWRGDQRNYRGRTRPGLGFADRRILLAGRRRDAGSEKHRNHPDQYRGIRAEVIAAIVLVIGLLFLGVQITDPSSSISLASELNLPPDKAFTDLAIL